MRWLHCLFALIVLQTVLSFTIPCTILIPLYTLSHTHTLPLLRAAALHTTRRLAGLATASNGDDDEDEDEEEEEDTAGAVRSNLTRTKRGT